MDKKNKIYVGIAVVAFAITAYLLYSSFSGGGSSETPPPIQPPALTVVEGPVAPASTPVLPATPAPAASSIINILPLGNRFDTTLLKDLNTRFNIFNYPLVTPDAVGIPAANLIKSNEGS